MVGLTSTSSRLHERQAQPRFRMTATPSAASGRIGLHRSGDIPDEKIVADSSMSRTPHFCGGGNPTSNPFRCMTRGHEPRIKWRTSTDKLPPRSATPALRHSSCTQPIKRPARAPLRPSRRTPSATLITARSTTIAHLSACLAYPLHAQEVSTRPCAASRRRTRATSDKVRQNQKRETNHRPTTRPLQAGAKQKNSETDTPGERRK